jgi:hypothetical protein
MEKCRTLKTKKEVRMKYMLQEDKKSSRRQGWLSLVRVVCCPVEVSAKGPIPCPEDSTDCGASLFVIYKPQG